MDFHMIRQIGPDYWWVFEISLFGNVEISVSHSKTLKHMLWKRTLGYLRYPGFLSKCQVSNQKAGWKWQKVRILKDFSTYGGRWQSTSNQDLQKRQVLLRNMWHTPWRDISPMLLGEPSNLKVVLFTQKSGFCGLEPTQNVDGLSAVFSIPD